MVETHPERFGQDFWTFFAALRCDAGAVTLAVYAAGE
jgi:hypothetical protein